jgi:hypothetical protein
MKWKLAGVLVFLVAMVACTGDEIFAAIDVGIQASAAIQEQVAALNPQDGAALAVAVKDVTNGLNAVQAAYDAWQASCATGCRGDLLAEAQQVGLTTEATLTADLAAAHITNQASVQKVTAWVYLVTDAVTLVMKIKQSAQVQVPEQVMTFTVKAGYVTYTAKDLKARWDKQVCGGNKVCASRVQVHHRRKAKGKNVH